ncbi:bleomycin hydrolase family protein [Limosilactobacillus frumenti DSM 13145]|uniref:Aminopeptidase n=1 Tax=Limosilactobacillus frumenti DSM 13145 TaxID=1423746 RepID=A0A0R1PEB4_9LACO|nr:C1 family peptidase [Limosilactobacillus frumenti]KRL28514.1 bleomycin hydrolase family protein [Limosilactobacillus frumenti DSM 13145]MBA2914561.1 C1 family peptidase [Limosilactobacillus frumenti]QFG72131.1 C1 family peptidase [Limosilactobacillus frumenti]
MSYQISSDDLVKFRHDYDDNQTNAVLENSVTKNGVRNASFNWHSITDNDPHFSIDLKTGDVADQKQSGRCWMFAALNTMRHEMQQKFNLPDDFELSQSYQFFWDKFEKANYFYENVLKTANLPTDDRKVAWLMDAPQSDGGQWDMLCALIEKYGVMPKSAMPESFNSNRSNGINDLLNTKLRHDAVILRQMVNEEHASEDQLNAKRKVMLGEVYRMLSYAFGEPATHFDFEYRTKKDHKFHREANLTPQEFFQKYIGWNLDDYISIIQAPTADKEYYKTYTIDMLGNVVGGRQIKHLNLPMQDLKDLAIKQLQAGESVWFGSDVIKYSETKLGIMALNTFDFDQLFNVDLNMSKADMLDYKQSMMDHAMVITGVDLVDGKPTKWKVENSWGSKVGTKGYFVMSDEWMDQYVYQIVVNKKYLNDKQAHAQAEAPAVLKPWDPMGTLA